MKNSSGLNFLIVGMAGTGKSTFSQRLYSWLSTGTKINVQNGLNGAITSVNMDAVVSEVKMPCTIDIRDFVNFKEIMADYKLGPNGAALACMNLFALKWDHSIDTPFSIIDTPGQIDAFLYSAPGDALCALLKECCIIYVMDLTKCGNSKDFVNNMLFATSLRCKFKQPVIVVLNKSDAVDNPSRVLEWHRDPDTFRESLGEEENEQSRLALYFDEFYKGLDLVTVSSRTGQGKEEFFEAVNKHHVVPDYLLNKKAAN